jgi:hypothetical protein
MIATLARRDEHPLLGEPRWRRAWVKTGVGCGAVHPRLDPGPAAHLPRHLDIISSVDARAINSAWWLGTVAGILEILLGFWGIPAGKGSIT